MANILDGTSRTLGWEEEQECVVIILGGCTDENGAYEMASSVCPKNHAKLMESNTHTVMLEQQVHGKQFYLEIVSAGTSKLYIDESNWDEAWRTYSKIQNSYDWLRDQKSKVKVKSWAAKVGMTQSELKPVLGQEWTVDAPVVEWKAKGGCYGAKQITVSYSANEVNHIFAKTEWKPLINEEKYEVKKKAFSVVDDLVEQLMKLLLEKENELVQVEGIRGISKNPRKCLNSGSGGKQEIQNERLTTFLRLLVQEMIMGGAFIQKAKGGKKSEVWSGPDPMDKTDEADVAYRKDLFGMLPRQAVVGYLTNQFKMREAGPDDPNWLIRVFLDPGKDSGDSKYPTIEVKINGVKETRNYCNQRFLTIFKKDCVPTSKFFKEQTPKTPGWFRFQEEDMTVGELDPLDPTKKVTQEKNIRFIDNTSHHAWDAEGYNAWYKKIIEAGMKENKVPNEELATAMYKAFGSESEVVPILSGEKGGKHEFVFEWRGLDSTKSMEKLLTYLTSTFK